MTDAEPCCNRHRSLPGNRSRIAETLAERVRPDDHGSQAPNGWRRRPTGFVPRATRSSTSPRTGRRAGDPGGRRPPPRALRPPRRARQQRWGRHRRGGDRAPDQVVDLQLGVNLRSIILFYRECIELLRQAGSEHRGALVVNMASMAAKSPQPWLSVYSATKAAVVAYTGAMNGELNNDGVKSVAFCPGFVDTDMSDFIKGTSRPRRCCRPATSPRRCDSCCGCRRRAWSRRSSSGARRNGLAQARPPPPPPPLPRSGYAAAAGR